MTEEDLRVFETAYSRPAQDLVAEVRRLRARGQIVLVFGGRDYSDKDHVFRVLDEVHKTDPIRLILEGGANGADALAHDWAESRGVPSLAVEAQWEKFGKSAGPLRNEKMACALPDQAIGFPGGPGSAGMAELCKKHGITTRLEDA